MSQPVDFANPPERYLAYPNKVEFLREHVLGLNRPEFWKRVGALNATLALSTETLKNVERKDSGTLASKTKICLGLNLLLVDQNYVSLTRQQVYSAFPKPEAGASKTV